MEKISVVFDGVVQDAVWRKKLWDTAWHRYIGYQFMGGFIVSLGGHVGYMTASYFNNEGTGWQQMALMVIYAVPTIPTCLMGTTLLNGAFLSMTLAAIRKRIPWWFLFLDWLMVILFNLLGVFAMILLTWGTQSIDNPATHQYLATFSDGKLSAQLYNNLLRGIIGCMLINYALMGWGACKDATGKLICLCLGVITIGCGGGEVFEVGMYLVTVSMIYNYKLSAADYGKMIYHYHLMVLIGNIFSAVVLQAVPYYMLYKDEMDALDRDRDAIADLENALKDESKFSIELDEKPLKV
eukprot:GHVU01020525.1.p1 GENE.GHVU01020525.1~~GHVU01020525.1.p1  ORF type:complete len:329 (-),score=38.44 GHVU01020525.1:705-1592(-)